MCTRTSDLIRRLSASANQKMPPHQPPPTGGSDENNNQEMPRLERAKTGFSYCRVSILRVSPVHVARVKRASSAHVARKKKKNNRKLQ
jgi:hypothetical protein